MRRTHTRTLTSFTDRSLHHCHAPAPQPLTADTADAKGSGSPHAGWAIRTRRLAPQLPDAGLPEGTGGCTAGVPDDTGGCTTILTAMEYRGRVPAAGVGAPTACVMSWSIKQTRPGAGGTFSTRPVGVSKKRVGAPQLSSQIGGR